MLEAQRLVKRFGGVRAVDDVSFTVGAGELANLEALMVRSAVAFMWLLPIGLAVLAALVWLRQRSLHDGSGLQFVDEPVWATQKLDLGAG